MKNPLTADGTPVRAGLSMRKNASGLRTEGGWGPTLSANGSLRIKEQVAGKSITGKEVSATGLSKGSGATFGDSFAEDEASTQISARAEAADVQKWSMELRRAEKRLKDWLKSARKITKIYEAGQKDQYQYNILYANTETLAPALYNNLPRPEVQRRFRDADTLGKAVSQVAQRTLEYLLDDNLSAMASFDDLMKSATLEALVPGWGVLWFKYEADFEAVYGESDSEEHEAAESPAWEKVENERIIGEHVPYDRFRHGYGKKWCDVPWVARLHPMTKTEIIDNFGESFSDVPTNRLEADDPTSAEGAEKDQISEDPTASVWEIWCKQSRCVYFVVEGYPRYLKHVEDPLNLSGFFPCPKPLTFVQKISNLTPVPLYALYEEQAAELNAVTVRINKLIRALKVRGMYDSTVEGLDKVLTSDDNTLVPAQNVAALISQGMTLEKSIWLMPLEKLIAVLQQLYIQREQVKQVIYELTGIADIMRGSSAASETLGAQKIKETWGTVRMKRLQKEVGRFARDCLRMMIELSKHFSIDTFKAMTGLQFPGQEEVMQAQMAMQQARMSGQQPPPEAFAVLQSPTWEAIYQVINDDILRSFKVDIETNSTVDAESTEDKQEIADVMNAISQFLNGVAPMVEQGTMPFDVAKEILLTIVRRFRFGPAIEDKLTKMAPPQPRPDPAAQKVQAQLEADKQSAALDLQAKQLDMRMKEQEMQLRQRELEMEAEFKMQEHRLKLIELQRKSEAAALSHSQKMQTMAAQAMMPKPQQGGGDKSPRR